MIRPPPIPVPIVSMTAFRAPRAAPKRCSARIATLASLSTNTGRPSRSVIRSRTGTSAIVQVDGDDRHAALAVDRARDAEPGRRHVGARLDRAVRSSRSSVSSSSSWRRPWLGAVDAMDDPALGVHDPDQHLRPAQVDADGLDRAQPRSRRATKAGHDVPRRRDLTMRQYYPLMPADGDQGATGREQGRPGAPRLQGLPVAPRPAEPPAVTGPLQAPRTGERQGRRSASARAGPPPKKEPAGAAAVAPRPQVGRDRGARLDRAQLPRLRDLLADPEVEARRHGQHAARQPVPRGQPADDPRDRHRHPLGPVRGPRRGGVEELPRRGRERQGAAVPLHARTDPTR